MEEMRRIITHGGIRGGIHKEYSPKLSMKSGGRVGVDYQ